MKNDPKISFDAALLLALQADAKREIEGLPTPKELKECYPDTRKWDIRLKNARNGRKANVWKRMLVSVATCCMLFVGVLTVNADFRNAVYSVVVNFTQTELEIRYSAEGDTLQELPEGYGEHYVPEEYGMDERQNFDSKAGFVHFYQNKNDSSKFYTVQCTIIGIAASIKTDNEHTTYTDVKINGVDALCGESINRAGDVVYRLIWDKDGIFHMVDGKIELAELIWVAESIY